MYSTMCDTPKKAGNPWKTGPARCANFRCEAMCERYGGLPSAQGRTGKIAADKINTPGRMGSR